jgi:hypothetical protein
MCLFVLCTYRRNGQDRSPFYRDWPCYTNELRVLSELTTGPRPGVF